MRVLKAHITAFLSFTVTSGLIMVHMMAGGDMIHFLSLIMKVQRNLKNIFWTLERNGCLHHTMLTDGDLTWRQIWDIVPSITMNSGKSSESQLRMPIHKLLFWRSIMAIHMTGSQAESMMHLWSLSHGFLPEWKNTVTSTVRICSATQIIFLVLCIIICQEWVDSLLVFQ